MLDDITFEVKRGECLGIIGPNGSGKSTLIRILSAMEKPDQGEIRIHQVPIEKFTAKELARTMAVLSQGGLQPYPVTVEEAVMMGRYPYQKWYRQESREDQRVVQKILQETGLSEMADRYLDELSGGERQRVAIARAMAQEPDIMLLDEPTTFLDIGYQISLLNRLKEWQRKNASTMVMVLHDLNLAIQYCDRILLMEKGKVCKWGSGHEVIDAAVLHRIYGVRPVIIEHPQLKVPQIILQSEPVSS